ncbi:DUF4402 domain-containing protein [Novosphingobium sp. SL115]|uniref:DUF4402 domain-containing protein n=1 Tax=Novosphingobium sp. SL115 TaxID=2995150 RepID=UPI00227574D4|nr:DUF4402 domain-containing protein [Novosphingobium sp. SL115]MCY1669504.1 DUF4402 domain-containing protein [Novosphingobium sp. SL115]
MQKCLFAVIAAGLAMGTAQAQSGNNEVRTGTVNAQVIRPLVLSHWNGYTLRFGRFTVGSTAGTVTISSSGSASTGGGVTFVLGSSTAADRMIVTGDANRMITITTGTGTVSNGAASMTFSTTPSLPAGYIPVFGSGYFTVGGTLVVASGQAPGTYSGTYPVTVAYN